MVKVKESKSVMKVLHVTLKVKFYSMKIHANSIVLVKRTSGETLILLVCAMLQRQRIWSEHLFGVSCIITFSFLCKSYNIHLCTIYIKNI